MRLLFWHPCITVSTGRFGNWSFVIPPSAQSAFVTYCAYSLVHCIVNVSLSFKNRLDWSNSGRSSNIRLSIMGTQWRAQRSCMGGDLAKYLFCTRLILPKQQVFLMNWLLQIPWSLQVKNNTTSSNLTTISQCEHALTNFTTRQNCSTTGCSLHQALTSRWRLTWLIL